MSAESVHPNCRAHVALLRRCCAIDELLHVDVTVTLLTAENLSSLGEFLYVESLGTERTNVNLLAGSDMRAKSQDFTLTFLWHNRVPNI